MGVGTGDRWLDLWPEFDEEVTEEACGNFCLDPASVLRHAFGSTV